MSLEHSPLLAPEIEDDVNTVDDTRSRFTFEQQDIKRFIRRRFWWLCLLGIAAIVALQLSFLPRTSPSRDFRRWHSLYYTRSDVKRIFLVQLEIGVPGFDGRTIEQNLNSWIKQLSAYNGRHANVSIATSGSSELLTFVEDQMRSMHFSTSVHTYPLVEKLRVPISLSLKLVDASTSRVLYTADTFEPGSKTPAYFLFGKNGTLRANYVFCNAGDPKDFRLLSENSVLLQNKIAIFAHPLNSGYSLEDKIEVAESAGCAGVVVFGSKDFETAISRNYKPISAPEERFRLPISYKAMTPILQTLGPATNEFKNWMFSPIGTSGKLLELILASEFAETRLNATNIEAKIEGILKDSEIVIGASRDTLTSSNPLSGHAIMLETMKRLSHLQSKGWKPLRSIRFVSWDASRSGALGSLTGIKDNAFFPANMPILAYINLDNDVVTGSHLAVDSSPHFNHVLKSTAELIPFPKNSTYYKRLLKDFNTKTGKEDDSRVDTPLTGHLKEAYLHVSIKNKTDYDDNEVSLLEYWKRQNLAYINNKLGYVFAGKDAGTFQLLLDTPVVNLRFEPSPRFNDSLYVPESETYSAKWVTRELDPNLDLHALLVRFLGLFVISLSEHEVVDSRTKPYVLKMQEYLQEMKEASRKTIDQWANETVPYKFFQKTEMCYDIQQEKEKWDGPVLMLDVLKQLEVLVEKAVDQAYIFDQYNQEVENLWTTDYPWYRMIRKIHIYAKFKVTNYKLLRLEKELNQLVEWFRKEEDDDDAQSFSRHFMYDFPQGVRSIREKQKRGAFAKFYEAFESNSMELVVRLAASKYERLKAMYKKIT